MAIIIDSGKRMTVAAAKAQGLPFPAGLHDESVFTVRPPRPAAPAATKTKPDKPPPTKPAKHKPNPPETPDRIVDDHDEEDDEPTDPDWDEEDDDDEEDEEERIRKHASIAAKGRADAARSEDRRIRSLRAQRSLEQQSEAERHAARVIAATAGHTGEPRFASLEDIDKQRAASRNRGGRIIDGKYVVGA